VFRWFDSSPARSETALSLSRTRFCLASRCAEFRRLVPQSPLTTPLKRVWDRLDAAEFAAERGPKGMARGTGGTGEVVLPSACRCGMGRRHPCPARRRESRNRNYAALRRQAASRISRKK